MTFSTSRIEAGRGEIKTAAFDLVDCLTEVIELIAPQAKGLAYTFQADTAWWRVSDDAGRVRQVVLNLLGNAIKFTAEGSVRLRLSLVETASLETGEERAVFSIAV